MEVFIKWKSWILQVGGGEDEKSASRGIEQFPFGFLVSCDDNQTGIESWQKAGGGGIHWVKGAGYISSGGWGTITWETSSTWWSSVHRATRQIGFQSLINAPSIKKHSLSHFPLFWSNTKKSIQVFFMVSNRTLLTRRELETQRSRSQSLTKVTRTRDSAVPGEHSMYYAWGNVPNPGEQYQAWPWIP